MGFLRSPTSKQDWQTIQGAVKLPCPSGSDDDSSDMGLRTYRTAVLLHAHATQSQLLERILLGL